MKLSIKGKLNNNEEASSTMTNKAGFAITDKTIAIIEDGKIKPIKDGTTTLICNIGGIIVNTTITIINGIIQ